MTSMVRQLVADVSATMTQMNAMQGLLESELSVGRWIWRDGRSYPELSWNIQCMNSAPANFLWSKDCREILCHAPGLYEICIGVFTEDDPSVHILVNGEDAFVSMTSPHHPSPHATRSGAGIPSGKMIRNGGHSAGNVTVLTLHDFFALPPRSRISVLFHGASQDAQGFLLLRKL